MFGLEVAGLVELVEALKLDEAGLLDGAFNGVPESIITRARQKADAVSPQASRAARDGLAAATGSVTLGSGSVPWALGAEFGSGRYKQFPAWRGNGDSAGYFLFPAIRAATEDGSMVDRVDRNLDPVFDKAFPN